MVRDSHIEKDTVEHQQNQQSTVFKCVALLLLTAAALIAVHTVNGCHVSEMETQPSHPPPHPEAVRD